MKLDSATLAVLKNFALINPNLQINPSDVLQTKDSGGAVRARAVVPTSFPEVAGISDLSKFLSVVGLLEDPKVEFKQNKFVISDDKSSIDYTYAAINQLDVPPDKNIKMPPAEIDVDVSWEDISRVTRAAGVLQVPDIGIVADTQSVYMVAYNNADPTTNQFRVEIAPNPTGETHQVYLKHSYLKLIARDYNVKVSTRGIVQFEAPNLQYWIGCLAQ